MKYYFYKTTNGCLLKLKHPETEKGYIEISEEEYNQLLEAFNLEENEYGQSDSNQE